MEMIRGGMRTVAGDCRHTTKFFIPFLAPLRLSCSPAFLSLFASDARDNIIERAFSYLSYLNIKLSSLNLLHEMNTRRH